MKILSLILVFFLINLNNLYGQNAPDTFADIIDPLLPSVVSIASTTIVEERQQQIVKGFIFLSLLNLDYILMALRLGHHIFTLRSHLQDLVL